MKTKIVEINSFIIDYSIVNKLGLAIAKEHNIFPIQQQELFILVATSSKIPNELLITTFFQTPIKFITVSPQAIDMQIENFPTQFEIYNLGLKALDDAYKNNTKTSFISNMVEKIITFAISLKASDIHIEALKTSVVIRFRIDGILYIYFTFEHKMYPLFSSILKLFANLDISQNRLPQNGRFSRKINNNNFDFRISSMPTINGESIVLRILDNKNSNIALNQIGFDRFTLKLLNKIIYNHQGMILVTGPTGSGKTTTMYSILNTLNTTAKKIITIEDPIEYNLTKIQQINVNEDIDFSYEMILKNILRQDPDIIMIGEIRDEKTLKVAIQASLTGHLVVATLHTNNAPDTINRLLDLNAKPYLIASTLKAIISQRLVRKLCEFCKTDTNKAVGCAKCNLSGYQGRLIVSEILNCDDKISHYISKKESLKTIVKYAKTKGYVDMKTNTLDLIKQGLTTIDEFYSKVSM
jgi:general secretion pathway protein E